MTDKVSDQPGVIAEALEHARAYERMAEFLTANQDLAERASWSRERALISVSLIADPMALIMDAAERGTAFGARIEEYANSLYGGVKIFFGPVCVDVYAAAEKVVRRVVVGQIDDVQYGLAMNLDGTPREAAEVAS